MFKNNLTVPMMESKRYRLSFKDPEVIANLEGLEPKLCSYFVEMALTDWSENHHCISTAQLKMKAATNDRSINFRLRIKNAEIVTLLDSFSPKFRSDFTETAVREWIEKTAGAASLKVLILRSGGAIAEEIVLNDEQVVTQTPCNQNSPPPTQPVGEDLNDLRGGFK